MKHRLTALTTLIIAFSALSGAAGAAVPASGRGGICGGLAGFQCKPGLYCDFKPSAHCGASDQSGTCRRRPAICAMIYKPVCGCDGKTYPNDCHRRAAGVGKAGQGKCG